MDNLTDLILSAQAGDTTAFGKLVERFQDMAFALAYAKVGHLQQAEDVAQEAFVEAYLHIDRLESPHAFVSWFRTIVNRQSNRFLRKMQPVFCIIEQADQISEESPSLTAQAETREMQETIHAAIQTLPENERQAIALFYIAGCSQKEIAKMLDVRLSTVKSRLYEARQQLRERMTQMAEEYLQNQRPSSDSNFTKKVMALIEAIETGNTSKATMLIEEDERLLEIPGKLSYGTDRLPPLFLAIEKGNLPMIDYLLSKGVDVNGKSEQGWTPHFYALNWNHSVDIAAYLRERGAVPDIYSITWMGKLDQLKALVEETPMLVCAKGPEDVTLLHFAPTVEVAQYLLDNGANINALDEHGKPPVGYRFVHEVNQFLLEQGAVVNDIMLACEVGATEVVDALLDADPQLAFFKTDNGTTPLLRAALNGHIEVVKRLLALNKSVNYTNSGWGFAPILAAALAGHLEIIQLLVELGADVNIRLGRANETALHLAMHSQSPLIAKFLLENGAEVDAKARNGATPLHWAVKESSPECIQLLLDYGADPKFTSDLLEESPLMRAERLGREDILSLLGGLEVKSPKFP
ncbi:MAG: sigma-70 family RNA polymerase sigma factor [Chloroflexota bacterium]